MHGGKVSYTTITAIRERQKIPAVKEYNLKVRRFPASMFASMFGFDTKAAFEAEEGAEKAPKVEF